MAAKTWTDPKEVDNTLPSTSDLRQELTSWQWTFGSQWFQARHRQILEPSMGWGCAICCWIQLKSVWKTIYVLISPLHKMTCIILFAEIEIEIIIYLHSNSFKHRITCVQIIKQHDKQPVERQLLKIVLLNLMILDEYSSNNAQKLVQNINFRLNGHSVPNVFDQERDETY